MSDTQLFAELPRHIEDALRASIKRFGVLVPVVKDQHGNLIDGHHRSRIADEEGVDYRVDMVHVKDADERREVALTLNADRRQLDPAQRREIVAELRSQGHSYRAIGGALGVGTATVHRDVRSSGVSDETPEQPVRVAGLDGKTYAPTRESRPAVVAAKNRREAERAQSALADIEELPAGRTLDVKRAERIARERKAEQRRQEYTEPVTRADSVEIRHGDFRESLTDMHGQVDAIITDPPYPREFVDLFDALGQVAAALLKPDGVLAVMVGQSHLRDYLRHLDEHMAYRWVGAYLVQGARNRVHRAKVGTGWKPILLYQRHDAADVPFLLDDLFGSTGDDKRHHHWGQSESGIASLVERLTKPGALVVDPFLGGGTTAVVCRDLGRRFIGCDIDADAVATSRERVA